VILLVVGIFADIEKGGAAMRLSDEAVEAFARLVIDEIEEFAERRHAEYLQCCERLGRMGDDTK